MKKQHCWSSLLIGSLKKKKKKKKCVSCPHALQKVRREQCSILGMHTCTNACASKIFYPKCTSACKFSITCFTMLVDVHNTTQKITFEVGIEQWQGEGESSRKRWRYNECAQPQHDENVESRSRSAGDEALPGTSAEPCGDLKCYWGYRGGSPPPGAQHKFCAWISSSTSCACKLNYVHVTFWSYNVHAHVQATFFLLKSSTGREFSPLQLLTIRLMTMMAILNNQ